MQGRNRSAIGAVNLGPAVEGETREVAASMVDKLVSIVHQGEPSVTPVCMLVRRRNDGDAAVRTRQGRPKHRIRAGRGVASWPPMAGNDTVVLSGGTDGEDGPTDAAGAVADAGTLDRAVALGLDPADFLRRHDAYTFFAATGDLLKTGLTATNVMDVRVILAAKA